MKIRLLVAEILSKNPVSLYLGHPVCVTEWEEGQREYREDEVNWKVGSRRCILVL